MSSRWIRAASRGAECWAIFGFWELFCLEVLSRLPHAAGATKFYDFGFSLLIIAAYASAGALVALPAAYLRPADPARLARSLAGAGLVLATLVGETLMEAGLHSPPQGAYYLLLLALAAFSAWPAAPRFVTRMASPWSLSLLVLIPAWTLHNWPQQSALLVGAVYLGVGAGIALLAAGADRLAGSWAGRRPRVVSAVFALAVSGTVLLLRPQPLTTERPPAGAPAGGGPNVILISLDTVRADHMSVYGYERDTTPALREFAREALVFTNAVAAGDMTLITHASLFTGLAGYEHHAHPSLENLRGFPLIDNLETLAEIFAARGYRTSAVVANSVYLGREFGMQQGFEYYDDRWPALLTSDVPGYCLRGAVSRALRAHLAWSFLTRRFRPAEEINREAFRRLADTPDGRPFFLFLNYMDAHTPYIPPEPFATAFPGRIPGFGFGDFAAVRSQVLGSGQPPSPEIRAHLISQYDGAIAYLDSQLGRLFDALKQRGLYGPSLIVVISDHGEAFGEDGKIEHSMGVGHDQVHVPLLIKLPGQKRTGIIGEPAGTRDLYPTILGILGIPLPKTVTGRDLLRGVQDGRHLVIAESYPMRHTIRHGERYRRVERAVYWGPWKFVGSTAGKRELYNLLEDPQETTNLYDRAAEWAERLEAVYAQVLAASRKVEKRRPPSHKMKQLRSLGYVQD